MFRCIGLALQSPSSPKGSAAEAVACKSAAARFAVPSPYRRVRPRRAILAILAVRPTGLILVSPHTAGATSVFPLLFTPLHSGHTFWQRRGCHTCMVTPFIPLLLPHENAYGENMHKHTVKPPLLLPNGGFTRPPEGAASCRRVPPGQRGRAQNAP